MPILRLAPHVQSFVGTTLVEPPFAFHWLGESLCTGLQSTTDGQWDHRSTGFQANAGWNQTRADAQKNLTDCNNGSSRHNTRPLPLQTPSHLQCGILRPGPTVGVRMTVPLFLFFHFARSCVSRSASSTRPQLLQGCGTHFP